MHDIKTLIIPRWHSLKNNGRVKSKGPVTLKVFTLGIIGVAFWTGLFAVSFRVLDYFRGIEDIGGVLADKLLSMIVITSFALLVFSSILTTLSKLYLSRDLNLVHSLPVSSYKVFFARWIDSTFDSSWMVMVYTLPVFMAYGIVYETGPFFYLCMGMLLPALAVNASTISALLVMVAVMIIPANRMKNIFIFLSLLFFVGLYLAIRLAKPELLVDPEVFDTVMVYVTALQTPSSPFLPSTWVFDGLKAALAGSAADGLFHLSLSWSFAGTMIGIIVLLADRTYFKGYSKTQTSAVRQRKRRRRQFQWFGIFKGPTKAIVEKEVRVFFRDQTQWSQLFLIGALVVIYIYNFKVLPLDKSPIRTEYLQNLLAFLNMGLALFVLTAVAGRFAYPAVSAEKEAFWLIKVSPSSLRSFLWIKFFVYYLPLLILTELLIVFTNLLLQVTPFMMGLSITTVFFLVPGIVSMGIGFGAAYPDFKAENPAQTVTSFGGLIFMIVCAALIGTVILIEAGPVYHLFMAGMRGKSISLTGWIWTVGAFSVAFAISILAIILPMRFGERHLSQHLI